MCIPYSARARPLNRSVSRREKNSGGGQYPFAQECHASPHSYSEKRRDARLPDRVAGAVAATRILRDNKAGTENEGGDCRCQPGFQGLVSPSF